MGVIPRQRRRVLRQRTGEPLLDRHGVPVDPGGCSMNARTAIVRACSGQARFLPRPAALRRASFIRAIQPGPRPRKHSSTSGSTRNEICSLTGLDFCGSTLAAIPGHDIRVHLTSRPHLSDAPGTDRRIVRISKGAPGHLGIFLVGDFLERAQCPRPSLFPHLTLVSF
jgi:hypothetical protein